MFLFLYCYWPICFYSLETDFQSSNITYMFFYLGWSNSMLTYRNQMSRSCLLLNLEFLLFNNSWLFHVNRVTCTVYSDKVFFWSCSFSCLYIQNIQYHPILHPFLHFHSYTFKICNITARFHASSCHAWV